MTAIDILVHADRFNRPAAGNQSDVRFIRHPLYPDIRLGAQLLAHDAPTSPDFSTWDRLSALQGPVEVGPNPHSRAARRARRPRKPKGPRRDKAPAAPAP